MSVDFVALAKAVVAGVADVRACLIVSRDGLALGACPMDQEERALAVWSQVATLGEVERGFVALRDEVWVFARRGPYGALATANPSARPGLLLDRLEQMLLAAEEARSRKDGVRAAPDREAGPGEASRRRRSPLHPEIKEDRAPSSSLEEAAVSAWVQRLRVQVGRGSTPPAGAKADTPRRDPPPTADPPSGGKPGEEHAWTVDRGALSLEFKGLLGPEDREGEEA